MPDTGVKSFAGLLGAAATATNAGAVWPGAYNANPNRQVGKLFFDKDPGAGTNWSHCTATAINTANKSAVLTAGHCASAPNSRQWYTNLWFYPVTDWRFPGYVSTARICATARVPTSTTLQASSPDRWSWGPG